MRATQLLVVLLALAAGPAPARGDGGGAPPEGAPAAPPGGSGEEVRARARALLGGIERPAPAEAFRELGPDGEAALEDIALSSSELPVWRARALGALAGVGSARAEPAHRTLAADGAAPRVVRRAAVRGLGRLVGRSDAPRELRPYLAGDRDPAVRAAAAEALASVAPRASCGAIRAQALREDPRARAGFRRALAACERR
ncbi:MAG TPA: HEAT repeat domain-containing protein [Anaeromyxobacter sp.]|nr:HEAT repeat domain-containing protein [Anaeromyxobacter sp.]